MEQRDYHTTILVPLPAAEVLTYINDISGWWAKEVEGETHKLGNVFKVRFGETTATMEIIELVQAQKVTWLVKDCYLDLLKDTKEWMGTQLIFELRSKNGQTEVSMTHLGLVPGKECYNDCVNGWNFFIGESLFNYLNGKSGNPGEGIHARISVSDRMYRGTLYAKSQPYPNIPFEALIIDVRKNNFEEITAAYSVNKLDKANFDRQHLKGNHYMIIENKPIMEGIEPMQDLLNTIK